MDLIWVKFKETKRDADGRHHTTEAAKQVPAKLNKKPGKLKNLGYTVITEAEANRINGIAEQTVKAAKAEPEKKNVVDAPAEDNGLGGSGDEVNVDEETAPAKSNRGRKAKEV